MADLTPPAPGQMFLFDNMTPPLLDNSYRMTVETDVAVDGSAQPLPANQSYFNVEGPRFSLASSEVAGVFPPRNGHGPFEESIPHIALSRRTLPWERELDSQNKIGLPPGMQAEGPVPWLALLLFEDGEYTLHQNVPLEDAVPSDVLARLGLQRPTGITCDTVEADADLVASIMPSVEELTLLSHVRWVSIEDRELSAGSSNGWFSVVMSNRVPRPGAKQRACLVSLEERADLVPRDPPPVALPINIVVDGIDRLNDPVLIHEQSAFGAAAIQGQLGATQLIESTRIGSGLEKEINLVGVVLQRTVQMVLLHSWQFECIGTGTFKDLMQHIDVGMTGKLAEPGHPPLTDTGHLPIKVQDRAGVTEAVWYRGPLVPFQLTRDPLGPYHSADQARRVTPETGGEDVSYAAAFEVGRLLAAADGRLGQELMRWRREAYRQSARKDSFVAIQAAMPVALALELHKPILPTLAASALTRIVEAEIPRVDPYGLDVASRAAGLQPDQLQQAWKLASVDEAAAILGGDAGALGATVSAPPQTPRGETTIDQVAADRTALDHLSLARDQLLVNTAERLKG